MEHRDHLLESLVYLAGTVLRHDKLSSPYSQRIAFQLSIIDHNFTSRSLDCVALNCSECKLPFSPICIPISKVTYFVSALGKNRHLLLAAWRSLSWKSDLTRTVN